MAVGDIYQVKFYQTFLGEQMLNVHYYRQYNGSGGNPAQVLAFEFEDNVVSDYALLQLDTVSYDLITVVNGMDNSDQYEYIPAVITEGSLDSGTFTAAPSNIAIGFRSNRNGIGTRYGYKRVGGFPLGWMTGNDFNSDVNAPSASWAAGAAQALGDGNREFTPVLITGGFKLNTVPVLAHDITQWTRLNRPSTQNTRIEGRGA